MRVAPALFAALAVGLLTWRLALAFGPRAGIAAGIFLGASPLVTDQRDVRGYTLALLAIVVMGIAVLDVEVPWLFATALAIGVGTHVYAGVVGVALVVFLWRAGRLSQTWIRAAGVGLLAGLLSYAAMLTEMGRSDESRDFRVRFPIETGYELLGGTTVSVVLITAVLVIGFRRLPSPPPTLAIVTLSLGVFGPWLLAPSDLYPRFAYYAVPAVALAVGLAVAREPRLLVPTIVACFTMVVASLGSWTVDEIPNRRLAEVAEGDVCAGGFPAEALTFYEPAVRPGIDCPTVAILLPELDPTSTAKSRELWPALCWRIDGAELRGHRAADCPELPPSD